ncbi:hypothetical protein BGZ61DRAFT_542450 [Ilyonectria robusta]|uniref:uncharacterized protein n=1 Tax=Ilyonectria robusta TaxID=1079257 RepID=UPI001E8E486D|nr:uncharacterized protein BGZ61DRAFT_542450 [Ilyonectria robusta]KAH8648122.1 hypothetical protein BGZ61DRAFT_542450 [Ilyonectria robusta]
MPRQEPVRVPIDEIPRTWEDLDGQRTQNRARGSQGASQSTVPNSLASQRAVHRPQGPLSIHFDDATLQDLLKLRRELVRVPHEEILRMLALLEPRREPVRVPHEEILRMLDHLDRHRAKDRAR